MIVVLYAIQKNACGYLWNILIFYIYHSLHKKSSLRNLSSLNFLYFLYCYISVLSFHLQGWLENKNTVTLVNFLPAVKSLPKWGVRLAVLLGYISTQPLPTQMGTFNTMPLVERLQHSVQVKNNSSTFWDCKLGKMYDPILHTFIFQWQFKLPRPSSRIPFSCQILVSRLWL